MVLRPDIENFSKNIYKSSILWYNVMENVSGGNFIMSTEEKKTETVNESAEEKAEKKVFLSESKIELITAIFLGLTALLMAWATWIGSLHGGNQATNYTKSNNVAAEGNAEYNTAAQLYLSDLMAWNTLIDYQYDMEIAKKDGDAQEAALIQEKIDYYRDKNCSERMQQAMSQINTEEGIDSPFLVEGFAEGYFDDANALLAQSQEYLEQGQQDNTNGDTFNLVTVIYSLVLFLLGIVGIFKKLPNRAVILGISVAGTVLATIYMFTIPMPTGFDLSSFF